MPKKKAAKEAKRKMAYEVAKMRVLVAISDIRESLPKVADHLRKCIICDDKKMEIFCTLNVSI